MVERNEEDDFGRDKKQSLICGYVKRSSSKIDLIFRDDILFGALVNMSAISKKSLCTF